MKFGKLHGICHAKAARKHRKRGHDVAFLEWRNGHPVYEWRKHVVIFAHVCGVAP